jgi:hypothetical protein
MCALKSTQEYQRGASADVAFARSWSKMKKNGCFAGFGSTHSLEIVRYSQGTGHIFASNLMTSPWNTPCREQCSLLSTRKINETSGCQTFFG